MPVPESPKPCPECGGERVAQQLNGATLSPRHPGIRAMFHAEFMDCLVCSECGLVTLYARHAPAPPSSTLDEGTGP